MRAIDGDRLKAYFIDKVKDFTYKTIHVDDVVAYIDAMPTVEAMRWIPVDERLPEVGVTVLVQMREGFKQSWEEQRLIEFGRISPHRYDIDGCGWEWLDESGADFWAPDVNDAIIAWMPLPQPWKGADDETD